MKRPDVFTELEAAAVGCIALEGTCIRSAYIHDLYVLICDYKGVTVHVVVPDSFNRYAVLHRVLGHHGRDLLVEVGLLGGVLVDALDDYVCLAKRFLEARGEVDLGQALLGLRDELVNLLGREVALEVRECEAVEGAVRHEREVERKLGDEVAGHVRPGRLAHRDACDFRVLGHGSSS